MRTAWSATVVVAIVAIIAIGTMLFGADTSPTLTGNVVAPTLLPNLAATTPMIAPTSPAVGAPVIVRALILNTGRADATVDYHFEDGNADSSSAVPVTSRVPGCDDVDTLAPGKGCWIQYRLQYDTAGAKLIRLTLDPDNLQDEGTRENDNIRVRTIVVRAATGSSGPGNGGAGPGNGGSGSGPGSGNDGSGAQCGTAGQTLCASATTCTTPGLVVSNGRCCAAATPIWSATSNSCVAPQSAACAAAGVVPTAGQSCCQNLAPSTAGGACTAAACTAKPSCNAATEGQQCGSGNAPGYACTPIPSTTCYGICCKFGQTVNAQGVCVTPTNCGAYGQAPCTPVPANSNGCAQPAARNLYPDNNICCAYGERNINGACKVPTAADLRCTATEEVNRLGIYALTPKCSPMCPPNTKRVGPSDVLTEACAPASCPAGQDLNYVSNSWQCLPPCPSVQDAAGRYIGQTRNAAGACVEGAVDTAVVIYRDVASGKMPAAYGGGGPGFIVTAGPAVDGFPPTPYTTLSSSAGRSCLSGHTIVAGTITGGGPAYVCRFDKAAIPQATAQLQPVNIDASWFKGQADAKVRSIDDNYYQNSYPAAFNSGGWTQAGNTKESVALMFRFAVAKGLVPDSIAGFATWVYWCEVSVGATSPQPVPPSVASREACLRGIAEGLTFETSRGRTLLWSGQDAAALLAGRVNVKSSIFSVKLGTGTTAEYRQLYDGSGGTAGLPAYSGPLTYSIPAGQNQLSVPFELTVEGGAGGTGLDKGISSCTLTPVQPAGGSPTVLNQPTVGNYGTLTNAKVTTVKGMLTLPPSSTPITAYKWSVVCAGTGGNYNYVDVDATITRITELPNMQQTGALAAPGSAGAGWMATSWGTLKMLTPTTYTVLTDVPDYMPQGFWDTDTSHSAIGRVALGSVFASNRGSIPPTHTEYAAIVATMNTKPTSVNSAGTQQLPVTPWGSVRAVVPPGTYSPGVYNYYFPTALPVLTLCFTEAEVKAGQTYLNSLSNTDQAGQIGAYVSSRVFATTQDPRLKAILSCGSGSTNEVACAAQLNNAIKPINAKVAAVTGYTVPCQ